MSQTLHRTDHVDRLEQARNRLAEANARIDEHGEETVENAATAYRDAAELLDGYVDRATGTGRENFKAYVQLEGQFAALVDSLPDELYRRDAFESALDAIDKRRLSESDFDRAEAELEPARAFSELFDAREEARKELEDARKAARKRLREIEAERRDRERLLELANADLDAPVEELREPIAAYNAAIREAFSEYRYEASAREVFAMLERSRWYPFVPFERPPDDLRAYVDEKPAGEYAIPELLEYAGYSRSKLSHYVEDADELKRQVATQRTYLDGIDASALSIEWPPGPAGVLRQRTRELRPFVERVGGEECLVALREVIALSRRSEYERLQTAAAAVDQLTPDERERLADGRVAEELEELRKERERLEGALEVDDPV